MSLLRSAKLWIAVFSLAAVMLFALSAIGRTSPGELTAVHGRDPKLAGRTSCSQCHGGWFQSMTDACLDCHEPIGAQIESGDGLHGRLGAERASSCAVCHSEHHGAGFDIVNRQSFAMAGVPDPEKFDHALVGFEMTGKHLERSCEDCHENARVDVLPEGAHRFLGLDQDCGSCHEDPHEGRMAIGCADCHGQQAFDLLEPVGHDRHLPLVGGHADVACATCHAPDGAWSLDAHGARTAADPRACADCHESPHDAGFVERVATQERQTVAAGCVVCHEHEHASFDDERLTLDRARHALSGFPLDEPHQDLACSDCHAPDEPDFRARHPGRSPDDCRACHGDPHGGQFDGGERGARACVDCHERVRFEPHAFDLDLHARTGFALDGAHLDAECSACHRVAEEGAPRAFRGTPDRCEACHADAHVGAFDEKLGAAEPGDAGTCAVCHGTSSFGPDGIHDFDHSHWTGFEVLGAHAQAACESCHPRGAEPDRFGRTFGRVHEHFGEVTGCVTCHTDPHEGRFDAAGLPAAVGGRSGCARCHEETSFRTASDAFEHGMWTGFPLVGAHRDLGCTSCHTPLRRPDRAGRTWSHARGTRCDDCHTDPHAGQLEVAGRTDCARCHKGTATTFAELGFDHDTQSRFRLGDAHASVACDACHKPFDHDGRKVVRYRPLARECADCHGTIRDPLRRGEGRRR